MAHHPRLQLAKDREEIILKFQELIKKADRMCHASKPNGVVDPSMYMSVRTSALNLLARLTSEESFYVRELLGLSHSGPQVYPTAVKGILEAALTDYTQGFMADNKLLVSAEVFADFLVQAEILLDNDYKDAAAVVIRAVLEDSLRRVCDANRIQADTRDGVHQLAEKLLKANVLTKVQFKEIEAKKEVGNAAAHGRFGDYEKDDVLRFHEFVQRLLATLIR
jgi:hypothetical protein